MKYPPRFELIGTVVLLPLTAPKSMTKPSPDRPFTVCARVADPEALTYTRSTPTEVLTPDTFIICRVSVTPLGVENDCTAPSASLNVLSSSEPYALDLALTRLLLASKSSSMTSPTPPLVTPKTRTPSQSAMVFAAPKVHQSPVIMILSSLSFPSPGTMRLDEFMNHSISTTLPSLFVKVSCASRPADENSTMEVAEVV